MKKTTVFTLLVTILSLAANGEEARVRRDIESGSYAARRPLSAALPDGPSAAYSASWELPDRQARREEYRLATSILLGGDDPELRFAADAASFFDEYLGTLKEEDAASGQGWLNWASETRIRVLHDSAGLLVLERETYEFRGGAHGGTIKEYFNLDTTKRKRLALDDVFAPGVRLLLGTLLSAELRRSLDLRTGDSLKEAGFFVEELQAVDRFYLRGADGSGGADGTGGAGGAGGAVRAGSTGGKGVVFVYGQYEIAPYSSGFTEIFLPEGTIRQLLRSGFELPE